MTILRQRVYFLEVYEWMYQLRQAWQQSPTYPIMRHVQMRLSVLAGIVFHIMQMNEVGGK